MKWLVEEASALVGLEDSDGETALHKACLSGRVEVAEYLVGLEGVQVECRDNDGWTVSDTSSLTLGFEGECSFFSLDFS